MKKTSTKKGFRDFRAYRLGAGEYKILWIPQRGRAFGATHYGEGDYPAQEIRIPNDWEDVPTLETLFHELYEVSLLRHDLHDIMGKDWKEVVLSTLAADSAEIATRNPEFWASLSL